MAPNLLFRERQRYHQLWIWMMIIMINVFVLTVLVIERNSTPLYVSVLISLPSLSLLLLFLCLRLDTEIREDGVYVRFFPLQARFRHYPWKDIDQAFLRQYEPIKEYGGWGIRGTFSNKALNIAGDQGLQLILANRRKLLIGTQQPEQLAAVLAAHSQELLHSPNNRS